MWITLICKDAYRGYYLFMYSHNNKTVAVELLPKYKKHTGRWTKVNREMHYYTLAKSLKVTRKFVKELFDKEKITGYIDIGSRIRDKAGVYRKRKTPFDTAFDTANISKKMRKIQTHKIECTSKKSPLCLNVFVTNQEGTVCLRCQSVDNSK